MDTRSIRQRLETKKAEIEAALRELDKIEALAGVTDEPPEVEVASSEEQPMPHVDGGKDQSIAQRVLDSIIEHPGTVNELAKRLSLSKSQVRNAITSDRLGRLLKRRRREGKVIYSCESAGELRAMNGKLPMTEAVVQFLQQNAGVPYSSSDVANAIRSKVASTASNFENSVASTLSNLRRSGRVEKGAAGGFQIPSSQIPKKKAQL